MQPTGPTTNQPIEPTKPTEQRKKTGSFFGKTVTWLRGGDNLFSRFALRVIAIALAVFLSATIIGIPLVYMGAVEWKRQAKAAPETANQKIAHKRILPAAPAPLTSAEAIEKVRGWLKETESEIAEKQVKNEHQILFEMAAAYHRFDAEEAKKRYIALLHDNRAECTLKPKAAYFLSLIDSNEAEKFFSSLTYDQHNFYLLNEYVRSFSQKGSKLLRVCEDTFDLWKQQRNEKHDKEAMVFATSSLYAHEEYFEKVMNSIEDSIEDIDAKNGILWWLMFESDSPFPPKKILKNHLKELQKFDTKNSGTKNKIFTQVIEAFLEPTKKKLEQLKLKKINDEKTKNILLKKMAEKNFKQALELADDSSCLDNFLYQNIKTANHLKIAKSFIEKKFDKTEERCEKWCKTLDLLAISNPALIKPELDHLADLFMQCSFEDDTAFNEQRRNVLDLYERCQDAKALEFLETTKWAPKGDKFEAKINSASDNLLKANLLAIQEPQKARPLYIKSLKDATSTEKNKILRSIFMIDHKLSPDLINEYSNDIQDKESLLTPIFEKMQKENPAFARECLNEILSSEKKYTEDDYHFLSCKAMARVRLCSLE